MPNASRLKDIIDDVIVALKARIGTSSGASSVIADANFEDAKFPWEDGTSHPGCFLWPGSERIAQGVTNLADDWVTPINVVITQVSNRDVSSNRDRLYYWRSRAMGRFVGQQRLPTHTDVYTTVEPGAVFDSNAFDAGYDATHFIILPSDRRERPVDN